MYQVDIRECKRCKTVSSDQWWKCCLEHTSERGPDVVCRACMEDLHPATYETAEFENPDGHHVGFVTQVQEPTGVLWTQSAVSILARNSIIFGLGCGWSLGILCAFLR
jgi:hypothetical protein